MILRHAGFLSFGRDPFRDVGLTIAIPGNGKKRGGGGETPAGHMAVLYRPQTAPFSTCCSNRAQQRGRLICQTVSQRKMEPTAIDLITILNVILTVEFQ